MAKFDFQNIFPNIFTKPVTDTLIQRINGLTPNTRPRWGKMNVTQMLAHCNVSYEMAFEDKHPKPGAFVRFMLKMFVKPAVCGKADYRPGSKTAPQFIIADARDFQPEKARLIAYLQKAQALGESHFHNKDSHSFGPLTKDEWNIMFYKHLNHHLTQFGV